MPRRRPVSARASVVLAGYCSARMSTTCEACGAEVAGERRAEPAAALLTTRESEVAALVADGLSNPEIAGRLAISTRTVTAHLASIRTKLGIRARTQIALWVSGRAGKPQPR